MIINVPLIKEKESVIEYNFLVKSNNSTKEAFIQVDNNFKELISSRSDAALVSMLLPAMSTNEDILVKGVISKQLFENLESLQDLIIKVIPSCNKININAENIEEEHTKDHHIVLTGFSAGMDSFVTLDEYYLNPKHKLKITHMLFNNLIYKDKVADDKLNHIKKLTDSLNIPIIKTRTNIHLFYNKDIGFEQTHSIRNAVIPHLLSNKGITFLYSSSFPKKDFEIKPWPDIAIVNTVLLPLLSTNNVKILEVGAEYTRVQKTKLVSSNVYSYDYLDICVRKKHLKKDFHNCSTCYKCMRALVTFEKLGVLEKYNKMFNVDLYYQNKQQYLEGLKESTQLNDVDLQKFLNGEINADT